MSNVTRQYTSQQLEARMDRFGLKLAAHLDEQALPHDISERLRVARQQAILQRKKEVNLKSAGSLGMSGGAAVLGGGDGLNWFSRLANAVPLLALVIGLVAIQIMTDDERAVELAQVDMQLLTDDLPPPPTPTPDSRNTSNSVRPRMLQTPASRVLPAHQMRQASRSN